MKLITKTLWLFVLLIAGCVEQQTIPEPQANVPVDIYLLPVDRFPEKLAAHFAKQLSRETGLHIRAAPKPPPLDLISDPDNNQYGVEDILAAVQPSARRLPNLAPDAYFIVLTMVDINDQYRKYNFYYSYHDKGLSTSVVSAARLLHAADGSPAPDALVRERFYKMAKRTVGEARLGWTGSTDRNDVMFVPINSLQDLDSIGTTHLGR